MSAICGASRGRYGNPIPYLESGIKFVDDDYNEVEAPNKFACNHINHWKWGKGTRNGQKLYYPTNEMYYQKWEMTEQELMEAVEQYDMFSIEMRGRMICKNCADNENRNIRK